VTRPDFEVNARLRAREVVALVPPDTQTEGEAVTLAREQTSSGLPAELEPGKRYRDVVVEKRLVGEQASRREVDEDVGASR
jgi:hypothetical protein